MPDDLVALLRKLIEIDSTNPDLVAGGAGEGEIAREVGGWLARRGVEVSFQEAAPGRPNVVGRVRGTSGAPGLMLNAHLDTVGTAGMENPFSAVVDNGWMYGRGAQDMKSGLAAAMWVMATVAGSARPRRDVLLAAVIDEEGESKGTDAILREWTASSAIVLEPTGEIIVPIHKGFVWVEIETFGVAAHGSDHEHGVDAIIGMGRVLVELDRLGRDLLGRDAVARAGLPSVGPGSLHTGTISGGREIPTYPDRCRLVVERRTVPGETSEEVTAEIEKAVARAGCEAAVRLLLARSPLITPPDAAVADALAEGCMKVLGHSECGSVPFWTDAALLSAAGIPSVVFGVRGAGLHALREGVDLQSMADVSRVLLATADRFCG